MNKKQIKDIWVVRFLMFCLIMIILPVTLVVISHRLFSGFWLKMLGVFITIIIIGILVKKWINFLER